MGGWAVTSVSGGLQGYTRIWPRGWAWLRIGYYVAGYSISAVIGTKSNVFLVRLLTEERTTNKRKRKGSGMGFSLSWIAVCGKAVEEVWTGLALQGTGVREEVPEAPIVGADLPSGCYMVVANRNLTYFNNTLLERLSLGCEIITCSVEEHTMYSRAAGWNDGSKVWEIEHDADMGIGHLETRGDLPPSFPSIHDHLRSKQEEHGGDAADTDFIFDIPVEVSAALTGYRYDGDAWGRDDAFEVLVTTSPSTLKPWQRWRNKRQMG